MVETVNVSYEIEVRTPISDRGGKNIQDMIFPEIVNSDFSTFQRERVHNLLRGNAVSINSFSLQESLSASTNCTNSSELRSELLGHTNTEHLIQ